MWVFSDEGPVDAVWSWMTPTRGAALAAVAMLVAAALGPQFNDAVSFHYPQIVLTALVLVGFVRRPDVSAQPIDVRASRFLFGAALLWLVVIGVTRFFGFWVNGVDFSVFDWMLQSTHHGRFGYSPIFDVNHFGVHSSFILLLWVPLHELIESPLWLVVSGPLAIWLGLFPVRRLVRLANGGPHGALELLAVLFWVANPWSGRALHAGFRPELLVPLLTLWFLVAWIERDGEKLGLSLVALWCTKEDSVLFIVAFVVVATALERWRWKQALAIIGLSALWLVIYVALLQPRLTGRALPGYWGFWSDFGDSPKTIVLGMLTSPLLVLKKLFSSSWWAFFLPMVLVPFRSPRAVAGLLPTIALLGTANYAVMHEYGAYYALPLLAFSLFGVFDVWAVWRTRSGVRTIAVVTALGLFPLIGSSYPRAVPVSTERHRQLSAVWKSLETVPTVCAQTVLFPHLGYSRRLVPLLDEGCLESKRGAVALVNLSLDSSPHDTAEFEAWIARWKTRFPVREAEGGFLVIGPAP